MPANSNTKIMAEQRNSMLKQTTEPMQYNKKIIATNNTNMVMLIKTKQEINITVQYY